MNLNKTATKNLRAKAHHLKPVVMMGQNGLTDNIHVEIDSALSHHELVKLRLPGADATEKKRLINLITKKHDADVVQAIGHIVVLYRRNKEKDQFAALLK